MCESQYLANGSPSHKSVWNGAKVARVARLKGVIALYPKMTLWHPVVDRKDPSILHGYNIVFLDQERIPRVSNLARQQAPRLTQIQAERPIARRKGGGALSYKPKDALANELGRICRADRHDNVAAVNMSKCKRDLFNENDIAL